MNWPSRKAKRALTSSCHRAVLAPTGLRTSSEMMLNPLRPKDGKIGRSLRKGSGRSVLLPKWTVCLSLRNWLSALYLMGMGVQNDLREVGEVKGPLYSESAIMSLWRLGRLRKICSQVKMPYTITRGKTISGKLQLLSTPVPALSQRVVSHSEGTDMPPTCQDHLIFNHVMGIHFLEFKVLQMCTDPCLTCV